MAEQIKENELRLNQVVKKAFADGGEPLHGSHLYVLEAMLAKLEDEEVEPIISGEKYQIENQIGAMLMWKPKASLAFMYPDTDLPGNFDGSMMDEEADSIEGKSPQQIAVWLLETLRCEL